jgi:hypothetical protein
VADSDAEDDIERKFVNLLQNPELNRLCTISIPFLELYTLNSKAPAQKNASQQHLTDVIYGDSAFLTAVTEFFNRLPEPCRQWVFFLSF